MKQRRVLRLMLATTTVAVAVACIASGSSWIGGGMALCAVAVGALPLAKGVSEADVRALLESLRDARHAGAPAVKAVVGTRIIFIGKSAISGEPLRGTAVLFRDEVEPSAWRELATLLRHQSRPLSGRKEVDQNASLRLGKSSDL